MGYGLNSYEASFPAEPVDFAWVAKMCARRTAKRPAEKLIGLPEVGKTELLHTIYYWCPTVFNGVYYPFSGRIGYSCVPTVYTILRHIADGMGNAAPEQYSSSPLQA